MSNLPFKPKSNSIDLADSQIHMVNDILYMAEDTKAGDYYKNTCSFSVKESIDFKTDKDSDSNPSLTIQDIDLSLFGLD